ncbi:hypothetical protein BGZ51_000160 [Haplosporangium sp. Z 767]|nr:hypothetical protein BGZ51_000160 [Haplosporangium sp. Z 767]KAF9192219.1 hypothetical protein BGZ50_008737 [Haplosporangium sp. Z 11]
MSIAIDSAIRTHSAPRPDDAVLIPELAFQIQQYLQPHDLATASLVSKAWQEAWTPFLYYAVRYRQLHSHYLLHNHHHLHFAQFSGPTGIQEPLLHHSSHHDLLSLQQYVPPFLNLEKYGHWIKALEVTNLFVAHHTPLTSGAASPSKATAAAAASRSMSPSPSSSSSSSPSPSYHLFQDHLTQIQTCSNMSLTQLDISKTVMSLERLDDLLNALPKLKVFKFEIMNKSDIIATGARSRSTSVGSISRGYMQQQPSLLLKKPKRISLEGQESEVVKVIAKRLSRQLERLELVLAVTGQVELTAFQELFGRCKSTLKSLELTRVEVCQPTTDSGRAGNALAYQGQITALLASLLGVTVSSTSMGSESIQGAALSSPSSSPSPAMSTSTSSSSISSAYSSPESSICSLDTCPPVLESLSFYSCLIPSRESEVLLQHAPGLRELRLHDCKFVERPIVQSILTHTPLLETLSLSSVPSLCATSLRELFQTIEYPLASNAIAGTGTLVGTGATRVSATTGRIGLRLKNVRLAYLRQLDNTIMKTLAIHQGPSLEKLSLQWCPHVTDDGVFPVFQLCEKLKDLSLCLSKPTLDIFKELTDPMDETGTEKKTWACAKTLERLEIGGQMFVDRLRTSNEHLHPQLYHHLSPNPHHIRNGSMNQIGSGFSFNQGGNNISSPVSSSSVPSSSSSGSIIHDPYSVAHHQGYPMYHLRRYHRFSDPFKELRAQLETLPRLTHLGITAKGIEHFIKKGFGPKVKIRSLALLNQQGRMWSADEIRELLEHMPHLRRLQCEKNTILAPSMGNPRDIALQKWQAEMAKVLWEHGVELVQSSSSSSSASSSALCL